MLMRKSAILKISDKNLWLFYLVIETFDYINRLIKLNMITLSGCYRFSMKSLSDGRTLAIGRHAEGLAAPVHVLVVVVVEDESAALLHQHGLHVVLVEEAQIGITLRDVALQVAAVAVVEQEGAGLCIKSNWRFLNILVYNISSGLGSDLMNTDFPRYM